MMLGGGRDVGLHDSDASYWTPLHFACYNSDGDRVEHLLRNGASVDVVTSDNNSPLHFAALSNAAARVLRLLLLRGAEVNHRNNQNISPLMLACYGGYEESAEMLVLHNADVNLADSAGNVPLCYVMNFSACARIADIFLRAGADVNHVNGRNLSPLHFAVMAGSPQNVDVLDLLIQNGTNVNVQDDNGQTPLHVAVRFAKYDYAVRLVQRGSVVSLQDLSGHTALYYAVQNEKTQERMNCICLMIASGLDLKSEVWLDNAEGMARDQEVCFWLRSIRSQVLPLKDMCRASIRAVFGPEPDAKLAKLELPKPIKRFLSLDL